jgi:hypothetical protein
MRCRRCPSLRAIDRRERRSNLADLPCPRKPGLRLTCAHEVPRQFDRLAAHARQLDLNRPLPSPAPRHLPPFPARSRRRDLRWTAGGRPMHAQPHINPSPPALQPVSSRPRSKAGSIKPQPSPGGSASPGRARTLHPDSSALSPTHNAPPANEGGSGNNQIINLQHLCNLPVTASAPGFSQSPFSSCLA